MNALMVENPQLADKVAISLQGSEFIVDLKPCDLIATDACKLRVTGRNLEEVIVNPRLQPGINGQPPCLAFSLPDIRIPLMHKIQLILPSEHRLDLSAFFARYQLDDNKLKDNVYLTNALFNAAARPFIGDDLFIVTYAYLNHLALDNPNFGGLITLLSYRITDQLAARGHVLDAVYATYCRYREAVPRHDAVAFRWLVSSSNALVSALLSEGKTEQAEEVADGALKTIVHPGLNPMVHQNYAMLLFQGGLIKAWKGRFDEAASLFIGAVNAGRYGMIDLLHPQNSWVLGQMSDCYKFLHIIEAAHCAALACTGNRLPPQARFAQIKQAPKLQINYRIIFDRFECFKKEPPPFFEQVLQRMQLLQNRQ